MWPHGTRMGRCMAPPNTQSHAHAEGETTLTQPNTPCMHARTCCLNSNRQVIIGLLRSAMVKSGAKEFLIDGFPRAMDQAQRFEEMIKPCK
jgi:adenylate kinase family enzyme